MSVHKPVLTAPHGGETVTSSGGSSVEMKVESSQSGGEYGTVLWTVRAGEEPPLHTHTREDELLYVVQGKLIARVGDARVEVGPGAYAALPRGVPHTIEVVGDQATLLLSFVAGWVGALLGPPERRAARSGCIRPDVSLGPRTTARWTSGRRTLADR
ncbi:quercetin dioxygenase-like cupin family protein [Bradyrhizobium japonicum]